MRFLTSIGCSSTSKPATVAVPDDGGRKHVNIRMVVVFPAPFGPRKPTICPFATSNEMWSTAVVRAYRLVSSFTLIIKIVLIGEAHSHGTDPHWNSTELFYLKTGACVCQSLKWCSPLK